jgi:RNA polymerase sigma-70 factor (ECF subfamily)
MAQLAPGGQAVRAEGRILDQARAMDRFLAGVERRAFRIAQMQLRDGDDALDAVQDAMLQLARNYGQRPEEEWKPLFYRILSNRVRDLQRRRKVRQRIFAWLPGQRQVDEDAPDPIEQVPDCTANPFEELAGAEAMAALEKALAALPDRQRQAFLLRNFEGLDVAATAVAMGCSDGSVKTHYFRAVHAMRAALGEHVE